MDRLFLSANTSTANFFCTSVAVVCTASALISSAVSSAIRTAPPMCPERSGITYCPFSSSTRTAESVNLSFTKGAIDRTAIPAAPIKKKEHFPQFFPMTSLIFPGIGSIPSPANFSAAYPRQFFPCCLSIPHRRLFSSVPVRVKLSTMISSFIASPFRYSRSPLISLILERIVLQVHSTTPGR